MKLVVAPLVALLFYVSTVAASSHHQGRWPTKPSSLSNQQQQQKSRRQTFLVSSNRDFRGGGGGSNKKKIEQPKASSKLAVPVHVAKLYGLVYWGFFGVLLGIVLPFVNSDLLGPDSPLGPLMQVMPGTLSQEALWLSHCWGAAMLTLLSSNILGIINDQNLVKVLAIYTVAVIPACGYAMMNDFGYFWKVTFPILYLFNVFVYVSAGWYSE